MTTYKSDEFLAITDSELHEMDARYQHMEVKGFDLSTFITPRATSSIADNVAVIHVQGALTPSAPPIHEIAGGTTYESIHAEIDEAEAAGVKAIIFKINSGGGSVNGLAEISARIGDLSAETYAFCEETACSAAYHIAAACNQIWATPSANVGNIGCVTTFYAPAPMEEIKVITNSGADLKGTGMNGVTDPQMAFLQSRVDKLGEEFKMHVKSNRVDISNEVFRAGWYYGEEALSLGLVDSFSTFSDLKSQLK